ncbi:unnamed protein product [Rodentolepis nana]|uniref:Golgin-84 n=1 Tax=Rodentolepis nana TaxID=102285 RepID=A0A0R3TUW1_RODNA|nr:unnamed protein product [Rodentolepis nana]
MLRERCRGLEERLTMEQQLKAAALTNTSAVQAIDTREIFDRSKRDGEEIRRLQFELVRLTTELTNAQGQLSSLEQRLDVALHGRLRYKDLWTRALQEVTRLRQEATNATKLELQRKEAEVEELRREQNLLLRTGSCMILQNNPGQSNGDYAQRSNSRFYDITLILVMLSIPTLERIIDYTEVRSVLFGQEEWLLGISNAHACFFVSYLVLSSKRISSGGDRTKDLSRVYGNVRYHFKSDENHCLMEKENKEYVKLCHHT